MQQKQTTGLIWFQNNLRVTDNNALANACQQHDKVIAVFVFDKKSLHQEVFGFKKMAQFRAKFLIEAVTELQQQLAKLNITLLTYVDTPENALAALCKTYAIDEVFIQKEWTAEETTIIENVRQRIPSGIKITANYDQFLFDPQDIKLSFNAIPQVFTQFRKHVEKNCEIRPEVAIPKKNKENILAATTPIPTLEELGYTTFEQPAFSAFPFAGGETAANNRIEHYFFKTKKLGVYKKTRNGLVGLDYSSKLSAWLANGSISAKTIYWKVKEYEQQYGANQSTYWLIFELIWRDYFKYIALKHGDAIFKRDGILHKEYEWSTDELQIQNWINGTTKEPFVNANMRELQKTGWMSNRGRQNVASYFAKELELDWRIGAAYFESVLIDYDVHSNYGNWMYVAGVGNDPRDRKFNVKLQAERYDATHKFQNLWLQTTLF